MNDDPPTLDDGQALVIPAPTDQRVYDKLMTLTGATTAANWLPADEDLFPELSELRDRHLSLRSRLVDELAALVDLDA